MGFRKPENSGCWYCSTDDEDDLGWYVSCQFDCIMHVKCLEFEINERPHDKLLLEGEKDLELEIFMRELGYELDENA